MLHSVDEWVELVVGDSLDPDLFVWDGPSPHTLTINPGNTSYANNTAQFGPQTFDLTASVAIANAVCDALSMFGLELNETPIRPEELLRKLRERR